MIYFTAFCAAYFAVALKAFQQLNVVHDKFWLIPLGSYGMAITEAVIILTVAESGLSWVVFWIGTGGWLGCWTSMWIHRRVRGAG